jgi:hypothetical protein
VLVKRVLFLLNAALAMISNTNKILIQCKEELPFLPPVIRFD